MYKSLFARKKEVEEEAGKKKIPFTPHFFIAFFSSIHQNKDFQTVRAAFLEVLEQRKKCLIIISNII